MTNRLQSLAAGGLAACVITATAGTAALWASEVEPSFTPGLWQITQQIETLEVPGLPAAMVERMAKDPKNAQPREACAENDGDQRPPAAMFHALGGTCEWQSWRAERGELSAVLACSPPAGAPGSASVSLAGTYTAESFALRSETIGTSAEGTVELRIVSQLQGSLQGTCSAASGA